MVLASRMAPLAMMPTQPLERPSSAMMSPTSAVCTDASPSITSTPPGLDSLRMDLSRALSWKHLTVVTRPTNSRLPPYCVNWVSQLRTSAPDLVHEIGRRGGEGQLAHADQFRCYRK